MRYNIGDSSVMKDRGKAIRVYVDGHKMATRAWRPPSVRGIVDGVLTSDNTIRPLMFADIQTTGTGCPPFPTFLPRSVHSLLRQRHAL